MRSVLGTGSVMSREVKNGTCLREAQNVDTSLPLEFSERLWHNLIDKVTVHADGRVVFRFRNGAEIGEKM